MTKTVNCVVCLGTGKQTTQPQELSPDGWRKLPEVQFDCIWCGGTGNQTPDQVLEVITYRASWCKCEAGQQDRITVDRGNTVDVVCGTCNGLIQVG